LKFFVNLNQKKLKGFNPPMLDKPTFKNNSVCKTQEVFPLSSRTDSRNHRFLQVITQTAWNQLSYKDTTLGIQIWNGDQRYLCMSIICRKHHVKASKFFKGTTLKGSIQYVPHVALLHFHPHGTYLQMSRLLLVLQLLALFSCLCIDVLQQIRHTGDSQCTQTVLKL
jgi:hypothetical protein